MPLGKNAKAGTYVDDFVHSKNKKFAGKSKKERIKMALGAYYGKHNESVEKEIKVINKVANDNPKRASKAANDNKPSKFEHIGNPLAKALLEKKMSDHEIEEKAHKGEKVGHGGFKKVEAKAAKEYGSEEAGKKVAAAIMWKKYGKK